MATEGTTHDPVVKVDLRQYPTWERLEHLLAGFDRLNGGESAEFINDHEPKALRASVDSERENQVLWDVRNAGDGRWIIRITRLLDAMLSSEPPRVSFLRRCTMFRTAPRDVLREIDRVSKERSYHDRMVIVAEGTNWQELGIVRTGIVEVTRSTDEGREIVLHDVTPNSMFNEAAVFDEGNAEVTVVARGEVEVIELPAAFVRNLVVRSPEVAMGVARFFAQRQRRISQAAGNLAFGRVLTRIARVLLDYASPAEGMASGVGGVERITQSDLAARVGTVRDMGSRALSHLEELGAIELRRGRVIRMDRAKLEEIMKNSK